MTTLADRPRSDVQSSDVQSSEPEATDPRDPELRLTCLFDHGTMAPLRPRDTSGAFAARGRIDGAKTIAYCTDATKMGGAMGSEGCRHIVEAIDTAIRERCPVIGLWHS
ncbi:MAG: carboxyl transferase domain-containing protein, partial [Pseudonocardiaceae bacterium]